jgi:hypothetical protein
MQEESKKGKKKHHHKGKKKELKGKHTAEVVDPKKGNTGGGILMESEKWALKLEVPHKDKVRDGQAAQRHGRCGRRGGRLVGRGTSRGAGRQGGESPLLVLARLARSDYARIARFENRHACH